MYKIILVFLIFINILMADGKPNNIKWQYELNDAKELALHYKKPIFLFLESRRCYYCPIMKEKTFTDPKIIEAVNKDFIPVLLDNAQGAESDVENTGNVPARLSTSMTPAIYFMGPDEEKLNRKRKQHMLIYGLWSPKELLGWLKDAKRKFKKLYGNKYDK